MSKIATESKIGKDDLSLATGNTGAAEQFTRITSTGGTLTQDKLDASHIKFRTALTGGPFSLNDLVDGGGDVSIDVKNITADAVTSTAATITTLTINTLATFPTITAFNVAGYLKTTALGVVSGGNSIAVADLPLAIPVANIADGSVADAEFQYLAGAASNIQDQLDALAVAGAVAASQAQMEAGASVTTMVTPGRAQYHQSAAKVWCVVDGRDGSPEVVLSYNVDAAVTDVGIGEYTLFWTTDFSSAGYVLSVTAEEETAGGAYLAVANVEEDSRTASEATVVARRTINTAVDCIMNVVGYGDQS